MDVREDKLFLQVISTMDPPVNDVGIGRQKLEEVKDGGPLQHCNLFDTEVTHKIAQAFLPGLASACVDNTVGGLFKTRGSVAVDIRKEMVDSLIQRSETFVAEAVVLEGDAESEVPDHPFDIISDFIDDFASSKRNFFSRVSGWLLSDMREDRIDDFVQEMEINGFWLIGRRETVAQTLLKNVDFKDAFHCNKKFNSAEELAEHLPQCSFRTVDCPNEGCNAQFTAGNMEIHDSVCPFKILPCEQKCSDILMRREMDRHCITVCPMKLVNCPFSSVGCQSTIPRCKLEQHNVENLHFHILYILQSIHKEAAKEDLMHRVEQLEKSSSPGQLEKARDVRTLTSMIKKLEAKLAPLEVGIKPKINKSEEVPSEKVVSTDSPAKKEEHLELPNRKEELIESTSKHKGFESPPKNEDSIESTPVQRELSGSPAKSEECNVESPAKKEELMDSPAKNRTIGSTTKEEYSSPAVRKELSGLPAKSEEFSVESSARREELMDSPIKNRTMGSPTNEEYSIKSPAAEKELSNPPAKNEEHTKSAITSEEHTEIPLEENESIDSFAKKEEHAESFTKQDDSIDSPTKKEEHPRSPTKREEHRESLINREGSKDSPKESEVAPIKGEVHAESSI